MFSLQTSTLFRVTWKIRKEELGVLLTRVAAYSASQVDEHLHFML
jgi:hypothetical protein